LFKKEEGDSYGCDMSDPIDIGKQLKEHKKAVLFAVPGAFTPTWYQLYTSPFPVNVVCSV
jgi:peroxiredoxin